MTQNGTAASTRLRIGFLFGGRSSEHSISVITAYGVLGVLDLERYDPVLIGITREGDWHLSSVEELNTLREGAELPDFEGRGPRVSLPLGRQGRGLILQQEDGTCTEGPVLDAVFPLLHGPYGEDGTLQGLLEMAGMPYVGSGVTSSAVGMDKHFMKVAFEAAGLRVGPYRVITDRNWRMEREESLRGVRALHLPVFVKPARAGSSTGITRVDSWEEIETAIETARGFDPKVVIEEGIEGREIECALLDGHRGQRPRASQPGEIEVVDGQHRFYDFEAKYVDAGSSQLQCPARLPEQVNEAVRTQAVEAFLALDCEGLARADFFVTPEGELIINEVNTLPGFTPISMYKMMWEASGVAYAQLVEELITLALERPVGLR